MSDNPKLLKNGGKGTFFGNLFRTVKSVVGVVSPELVALIETAEGIKDVGKLTNLISKEKGLSELEKELLFKQLEQDVIEMQEVTKRWSADMNSDSWLSKNIRPLSLAFLTLSLFLYIILDSSLKGFKIDKSWIDLMSSLLLLTYGGYFGARALEKITSIKQNK